MHKVPELTSTPISKEEDEGMADLESQSKGGVCTGSLAEKTADLTYKDYNTAGEEGTEEKIDNSP